MSMSRRFRLATPRPAVLMYHRVADERTDPWGLSVRGQRFEQHLGWLARHREVMPLAELARRQRAGNLPARAVALTFDDGYACNALTAVPMLVKHGLPATIFVTTRPVTTGREYWWDDLQRIVLAADVDHLTVHVGDRTVKVMLGTRDADTVGWASGEPPRTPRQRAFMTLWSALRLVDATQQEAALEELREQSSMPVAARASHRPMTPDELRQVSVAPGVDIGAHTVNHPSLSAWPVEAQRVEVEGGRLACAELIGRTPIAFAYPYGDHTEETVQLVREVGFEVACTTEMQAVTRGCDVLALPRVQVEEWSTDRLARVLGEL